jgi:hypothetical protein
MPFLDTRNRSVEDFPAARPLFRFAKLTFAHYEFDAGSHSPRSRRPALVRTFRAKWAEPAGATVAFPPARIL